MLTPLEIAMSDPAIRPIVTGRSLFAWEQWYEQPTYDCVPPKMHKAWLDAIDAGLNVVIVGARAIGKTVHVRSHVLRGVCQAKKRCNIWACADKEVAEGRLGDITTQLQQNSRIQADYGRLYRKPKDLDDDQMQKSKLKDSDFITSNGVRVMAGSPGMNVRGAQWQDKEGRTHRPDLIVVDDIDTNKTSYSPNQIDKLYRFVTGELMGAENEKCQFIILGNVITNDGVAQRLYKEKKGMKGWACFWEPLIAEEDGKEIITWPDKFVWTDEEAERLNALGKNVVSLETKLRNSGEIAFNQNYRLRPHLGGQTVIRREWMKWAQPDECIPGAVKWDYVSIGADPAISQKALSDMFGVCVVGWRGEDKYILASYGLKGPQKDPTNVVAFIKQLYAVWQANVVNIETVAFQTMLAKLLKDEKLAVVEVHPHKDKVTRLREFQADFQNGKVYFNPQSTESLVDVLLAFPNVTHDDEVDAMVYAMMKPSQFYFAVLK